jgi:DNA polymerase V
MGKLLPEADYNPGLFADHDRRAQLSTTIDQLNRNYGRGTVRLASEGLTEDWRMRQDLRSPCYTTRLSDILQVR